MRHLVLLLGVVCAASGEQDLWIELPPDDTSASAHHPIHRAHADLSQRVLNLAQVAISAAAIPATPLDQLAEIWEPCADNSDNCRMAPAPPPCTERDSFLENRAKRNDFHAAAKTKYDTLTAAKANMSKVFGAAANFYQTIVTDPYYTSMPVDIAHPGFVGCFNDPYNGQVTPSPGSTFVSPISPGYDSPMDLDACVKSCAGANFKFVGRYGQEVCLCSNAVPAANETSTDCSCTYQFTAPTSSPGIGSKVQCVYNIDASKWARYEALREAAMQSAGKIKPLLVAMNVALGDYSTAERAMEAAYAKTLSCPNSSKSSMSNLDVLKQASVEVVLAQSFWSCTDKQSITAADSNLIGDSNEKVQQGDCMNWGFPSLESCQVRCKNLEACGGVLYNGDATDEPCGQTGYCGMASQDAASSTVAADRGTMCVKQKGLQDGTDTATWTL